MGAKRLLKGPLIVAALAYAISTPASAQTSDPLYCLYWGCDVPPLSITIEGLGILTPDATEHAVIRGGQIRAADSSGAAPRAGNGPRKVTAGAQANDGEGLHIKGFKFTGNTLLSATDFEPATRSAVGPNKSLTDVLEAALEVRRIYRSRGMLFAQVFIPEQPVGGVVELEVVEGRVGNIKIKKAEARDADAVARQIGEVLVPGEVLSEADLRGCELYFRSAPELDFQLSFAPGSRVGFADVTLDIKPRAK